MTILHNSCNFDIMLKRISISAIILLSFLPLAAQEYSAVSYWKMEQDITYISLLDRQNAGSVLTAEEQKYINDYKQKLAE